MNPFDIDHWPNRIVSGPGAVAKLGALAAELGAQRALMVCGATVARGEMLARAREGLGAACAGVFDRVEAQNPLPCVRAGAAMARELGADLIVSVGGGSAIDAAKCMVMLLASGGDLGPYIMSEARKRLGDNVLPHIAVPTTTGSSSEVMPSAGCRDPQERRKLLFLDAALVPKVVVLDPQMAAYASPELTAHSGMTAVASRRSIRPGAIPSRPRSPCTRQGCSRARCPARWRRRTISKRGRNARSPASCRA